MIYQNVELYNIAELVPATDGREGLSAQRVPESLRLSLNEGARERLAYRMAGAEIRFVIEDDSEVKITLRLLDRKADMGILYYGALQGGWRNGFQMIYDTPTTLTFSNPDFTGIDNYAASFENPFSTRVHRLLLPTATMAILSIEGNCRPPRPEEVPSESLLCYGSSITFGSLAGIANGTWTSQLSRMLGMDVQNHGYADSCFIEPEMADWIANKGDWQALIAELGVNVTSRFTPEEYRSRVRYFLERVHKANPDQYMFMIDLFYSKRDLFEVPNTAVFRTIMQEEVARVNDPHVIYINGLSVLSEKEYITADLTHPSLDGAAVIANRLFAIVAPYLI